MLLSPYKLTQRTRMRYRGGATALLQVRSSCYLKCFEFSVVVALQNASTTPSPSSNHGLGKTRRAPPWRNFPSKPSRSKRHSIQSDRVMSNALFSDFGIRVLKFRVLSRNQQIPLRLNQYPTGCGKGHDTAVLGAWLLHEISSVDEAAAAASWSGPNPQSPKLNPNSDRPHTLSLQPRKLNPRQFSNSQYITLRWSCHCCFFRSLRETLEKPQAQSLKPPLARIEVNFTNPH